MRKLEDHPVFSAIASGANNNTTWKRSEEKLCPSVVCEQTVNSEVDMNHIELQT